MNRIDPSPVYLVHPVHARFRADDANRGCLGCSKSVSRLCFISAKVIAIKVVLFRQRMILALADF